MSEPRKNHFIPEFYLKSWGNPIHSGMVVEHSRPHMSVTRRWKSPSATGFEIDLYAFDGLPSAHRQYLEKKFFQTADDYAAKAYQLLLNGFQGPWDPILRRAWSLFLVGIHLRHPDTIPELKSAAEIIWNSDHEESQRKYESIRKTGDPARFTDWAKMADPHINAKAQLRLIMGVIDNERLCSHFDRMSWDVLEIPSRSGLFLTSDRALQITRLRHDDGFVCLPLSPNRLFLASNKRRSFRRLRNVPSEEVTNSVNQFVAARARRFVWSFDRSQNGFVDEYMSVAMEQVPFFPELSTFAK